MPTFLPRPPDDASPTDWVVACLCAAWCGSCRDYRAGFEAQAAATPWARFAWIDIEDESDWLGDVEIESFPTLLVARGTRVLFFGPLLPHASHLQRLLAQLHGDPLPARGLDAAVLELACKLAA